MIYVFIKNIDYLSQKQFLLGKGAKNDVFFKYIYRMAHIKERFLMKSKVF